MLLQTNLAADRHRRPQNVSCLANLVAIQEVMRAFSLNADGSVAKKRII
jgi:hypothetical protein